MQPAEVVLLSEEGLGARPCSFKVPVIPLTSLFLPLKGGGADTKGLGSKRKKRRCCGHITRSAVCRVAYVFMTIRFQRR